MSLHQKAIDQGDARAQHYLSVCDDNGTGVAQDLRQAVARYQKAADQCHAGAQLNFACALRQRLHLEP